jgi:hypothetical protein
VLCCTCAPFWATIVVGIARGPGHREPFAPSTECGPIGRVRAKEEIGTSGSEANVVRVLPALMFVLPTSTTRTPPPSSCRSRSGNASPPWETR